MKRSRNGWLWGGFILVLAGLLSYIPFFALFPVTRDFPWVNLLLIALGLALLSVGLVRAFGRPQLYRGRVFGTAMMLLGVTGAALFCWGLLIKGRQLPASTSAPHVGQMAPDFALPDQDGRVVALADLLAAPTATTEPASAKPGGVLLIFYRGHW